MASTVAIVTGAAGAIGCAICRRLAEDHDIVLMADLDEVAVIGAAHEMGDAARFLACATDVTSEIAVAAMVATAAAQGDVRTLVNNAGGSGAASLRDTTPDHWRKEQLLNLEAPYLCFRAAEPHLAAARGSVVNIASVNGLAVYGHPAYSAAKSGLVHLTRLIAVEYGRRGIRANAVAPGTVRTQAWNARAAENPNVFDEAARWYPLGRIVEPAEVAAAVGFLASPAASAITGICLPVDCGLLAGQGEVAHTFSQSDHY